MKNLFKLALAALMVASLAACSSDTTSEETATPEATEETTEVTPEATEETTASAMEVAVNAYYSEMHDNYKISEQDLFTKVSEGTEDFLVVDIRGAADYAESHVMGAINLAWPSDIANNVGVLPMSKPIYVYCYTGQTAGQTVAELRLLGFDAYSVNMGMKGISTVEGIDAILTDEAVELPEVTGIELDADMLAAVEDYFAGLADVAGTEYANYKISEENAKAKIDAEDDSIMVLSIRSAADYAEAHIPTAVNIPWGNDMAASFSDLPMDKTIIVYCYTGQTAGQATATLRMLGYDAVSMNGGFGTASNAPSGWNNQGYPTVSSAE